MMMKNGDAPSEQEYRDFLAGLHEEEAQEDAPPAAKHFVPTTLDAILSTPKARWLVPGLLAEGSTNLLSGAPKAGKTLLMLAILKAASGDGRFLGLDIPAMHSWLFSEQSAHALAPQLEMLSIKGDANITPYLWREQPTFDSNEEFADTLYKDFMAASPRPQIVVIDTLATFIGIEDSNDYTAVKRAMTPIIQAAQTIGTLDGAATMFVHHNRKSGGAGSESILGSTDVRRDG